MSTNHNKNVCFKDDSILCESAKNSHENVNCLGNYMNLMFLGLFEERMSAEIYEEIARVETILIKTSRENYGGSYSQVTIGTSDVNINPKGSNGKIAAINIPTESFELSDNSYALLLKVETFPKANINNNVEEPSSKRQKRNTKVYGSELVIFDMNNRCFLTGGEYELALHDNILSTPNKYSTWETIPDELFLEHLDTQKNSFKMFSKCPTLKFRLKWTSFPLPGLVDRPEPIVQKIDEESVISCLNNNNSSIKSLEISNVRKVLNTKKLRYYQNVGLNPEIFHFTKHNRIYYHSETYLSFHPNEIEIDSADESEPLWIQKQCFQMIDDFTDVNEGEKDLMKMWNLYVMKHCLVADCQLPLACDKFLELHGREIIQKNLYYNFILHLCSLFDYGLVSPEIVRKSIQKLQVMLSMYEAGMKVISESRKEQLNYWTTFGKANQEQKDNKTLQSIQTSAVKYKLQQCLTKPAKDQYKIGRVAASTSTSNPKSSRKKASVKNN